MTLGGIFISGDSNINETIAVIEVRIKAHVNVPVKSIVQPASGGAAIEPIPMYRVHNPIILPAYVLGK